jgi:hypothetical protein
MLLLTVMEYLADVDGLYSFQDANRVNGMAVREEKNEFIYFA